MLKVVIADDEDKICQLIYKLINWEAIGMQVVAIAHNGIEALDQIHSHNPDIVITDIRMPGLDGLEFISKAREYSDNVDFIIISGYQQFEYAQRAIKYGVSDYLLKPIKKDELIATLTKMRNNLLERAEQLSNEEKMKLNLENNQVRLRTGFFNSVLFQKISRKTDMTLEIINREYEYNFQKGLFQIITVKLDGVEHSYNSNVTFLEEKVIQIIKNNFSEFCYEMQTYFENSICYSIINYCSDHSKNIRRQCKLILDEICVQKEIFENLEVTVGLGTVVEDIREIDSSLKSAAWAYEQRLVMGTNRVIDEEPSESNQLSESKLFYDFNKEMNTALERLDKEAVIAAIRFLKEGLRNRKETSGHEIIQMTKEVCNLLLFAMRNQKFPIEDGDRFFEDFCLKANDYGSVSQLFHFLTTTVISALDKVIDDKRQKDTRPIRMAKQMIQEN
jgi:two-component system response regulator YesN